MAWVVGLGGMAAYRNQLIGNRNNTRPLQSRDYRRTRKSLNKAWQGRVQLQSNFRGKTLGTIAPKHVPSGIEDFP